MEYKNGQIRLSHEEMKNIAKEYGVLAAMHEKSTRVSQIANRNFRDEDESETPDWLKSLRERIRENEKRLKEIEEIRAILIPEDQMFLDEVCEKELAWIEGSDKSLGFIYADPAAMTAEVKRHEGKKKS